MTNDEIIAMAKQAHHELVTKHYAGHRGQIDAWTMVLLEIFAKLVAEKEREECARLCDDMSNKGISKANINQTWRRGCRDSADAIRARGKE